MQHSSQTEENASKQQQAVEQSLDERINAATVSDYQNVLGEIAQINDPVLQDSYAGKLANVLKVTRTTVSKVLKEMTANQAVKTDGLSTDNRLCAVFPELVDLVLDDNNEVCYLVKTKRGLELCNSWELPDGSVILPPMRTDLVKLVLVKARNVMEWYDRGADEDLYRDLCKYLKRFSYLQDDVWPLIAFFVFLTYIQDHEDINYLPIIYFYAVAERGKSRTAKSMLYASYRGHYLGDLASANIFRLAENLNSTLYLDITDLWKTAEKTNCTDILLNRFEKGATIPRVMYPDRGAFRDQVHYSIYGPTIVTTNEPVNYIFESRCIPITMPNVPGDYEDITPDKGVFLKDRLTAWRARMLGAKLPSVEKVPGITGRLWEITKPIFRVCNLVNPDVYEQLAKLLLGQASQKFEDKKDTLEGKIISGINALVNRNMPEPWVIPVSSIREKVNDTIRNAEYHYSPQKIGKRIKSLSIISKDLHGYAHVEITKNELDLLCVQHGLTPLSDTLPHSTIHQDAAITATEAGSESADKQKLSGNSPTQKPLEIQADMVVVGSGSELQSVPAKSYDENHQAYLNLMKCAVTAPATETLVTNQPKKIPFVDWGGAAAKAAQKPQAVPTIPENIEPTEQEESKLERGWKRV